MKTLFRKLLLFLCFAFLFYCASLVLWERFLPDSFTQNVNYKIGSYGHMNSRIKDIPNYPDVDILILGSSHAYRGFDTRIFAEYGIKAFNLGSSAQTPIQTRILLDRYLEQLDPDLIIYEVYPSTLSSDGVESALDLIANDQNDLRSIRMAFKINNVKVYNTLIYGIFRDLFALDREFVENPVKGPDRYIEGGYVEKSLQLNNDRNEYKPTNWNTRPYQVNAFEEILTTLEEKGIEVILIQAPITTKRYSSYQNNSERDSYYQNLGVYFNFNDLLELSDRDHFYDSHHLNQNGVEIFNQEVIKTLSTNGYLDFLE